jgi:urease accessory protein
MEQNSSVFTIQFAKERMMRVIFICMAFTGALVSPTLAHTGVEQANSFASGIAHPLSGADHILAMVAVGLWGVLAGGRAIWVWPMAFVTTMLAGFAAATLGLQMPLVEPAIWSSIIILGLFVALAVKAPVWLGAAIVGFFAFFHGHAHGTQTSVASVIPYAAGFALATAGLHVAGVGGGLLASSSIGKFAVRALGGGIAVLGAATVIGG